MATLREMADKLLRANPGNDPMYLDWMAAQWWPEADWLKSRPNRHNGGARTGARVAAGFAGRMAKAGLLRPVLTDGPVAYRLAEATTDGAAHGR